MTTVAVDLLGGDGAPEVVADALARVAEHDLDLIVVGPAERARDLLADRGLTGIRVVDAGRAAPMAGNPLGILREHDDVTVTVAAGLVRAGLADAWVSAGHTGAAVAAAVLTLGRLSGMARPALAVVVPALAGPVVLLDAGASTEATPDVLRQFALAGWAYATSLGLIDPAVGLLTIGTESGKGDAVRRSADELLRGFLPAVGVRYAGPVEGHDLALGQAAQVVVTDGFTGNVLLKGIEGAALWAAHRMGAAYGDPAPAREVVRATASGDFAGGMLLGVQGVTVVGHGAATPDQVAACIRLAGRSARMGLVPATQRALAALVGTRP